MFDMHFHSTLSDGKNSPEEIIQEAKKRNLKLITLTDHDVISSEDFIEKSNLVGIKSIHSTEISARDNVGNKSLHLTCYSNSFSKEVYDILSNTIEKKQLLIDKQIEKLSQKGFIIDKKEFFEYYKKSGKKIDSINRFNIAMYLFLDSRNVQFAKKISKIEDINIIKFFEEFLKEKGSFYKDFGLKYAIDVPEYEPSIEICGELARNNNAILSIAHPNLTFKEGIDQFKKILPRYIESGINAIEINPKANIEWIEAIYEIKEKFEIIITAGSDNHYIGKDDEKHGHFGELNSLLTHNQKENILKEFLKYLK